MCGGRAVERRQCWGGPASGGNDGVRAIEIAWAIALWGGVTATLFTTGILVVALGAGLTRFSPIRCLGCIVTPRPDSRSNLVVGFVLHMIAGSAVFPALYAIIFELAGRADALFGFGIGGAHGVAAGLLVPVYVSRTRCARSRSTPNPGIFARKLGTLTPMGIVLIHAVYGAILGFVYAVPA